MPIASTVFFAMRLLQAGEMNSGQRVRRVASGSELATRTSWFDRVSKH